MASESEKPNADERVEQRRQQILDAAADCFQRRGFHGTSMAEISKAAGMSVGHIYHYYENKDAVIKAMVQAKAAFVVAKLEEMGRKRDVLASLVANVREAMDDRSNQPEAALKIEILAEAARNADVLETLRAADRCSKAKFQDVLRSAYPQGCIDDDTLHGMTTILSAIYEGLTIRALVAPDFDREAASVALRRAVEGILYGNGRC